MTGDGRSTTDIATFIAEVVVVVITFQTELTDNTIFFSYSSAFADLNY